MLLVWEPHFELLARNPWVHHGWEAWEEMRAVSDGNVNADMDKGFKS